MNIRHKNGSDSFIHRRKVKEVPSYFSIVQDTYKENDDGRFQEVKFQDREKESSTLFDISEYISSQQVFTMVGKHSNIKDLDIPPMITKIRQDNLFQTYEMFVESSKQWK